MTDLVKISRLADVPVWSFNSDGSVFDLAAPDQASVCFVEMAKALSGIRRFNGRGISDAQHCAMGAQAILNEGGTHLEAALYLLHDAHEWALGDIIAPTQQLLACLLPSLAVREAIRTAKAQWDDAIYSAARLPVPEFWTTRQRRVVKDMDDRMCRAEAIELFGPKAGERFPVSIHPKTKGSIRIWGPAKAEEEFAEMAHLLIGSDNIADQAAFAAARRRA